MKQSLIALGIGGPLLSLLGLLALAAAVLPTALNLEGTAGGNSPGPPAGPAGQPGSGGGGLSGVPPDMVALYAKAAASCPGLPWTVLAAIGTLESANGTSRLPGVTSGHNSAGAEGPMQFLPATFNRYARPVPPGGANPPSPYDGVDAVFAAARMLCADGGGAPSALGQAVFDYNHSTVYVAQVLQVAESYGLDSVSVANGAGTVAVSFALAQVGTPYRWGGEAPGVGFDCSGLVQAAWAAAGVSIPRVAQDQLEAGPPVPPGSTLEPGDLVFFGPSVGIATHVGMVVDGLTSPGFGVMVDAPHTGAQVRVEVFPTIDGDRWGTDIVVGATDPGAKTG